MSIATTVGDALAFEDIDFTILRHAAAADAAEQAGVAPERLAKAVLLKDSHGYLLTVLPASRILDIAVLRTELRGWLGTANRAVVPSPDRRRLEPHGATGYLFRSR